MSATSNLQRMVACSASALSLVAAACSPAVRDAGEHPIPAPQPTPIAVASSAPTAQPQLGPSTRPPLSVLPSDFDFSANPAVIGRIAESPHRYFRFINPSFAALVCLRYADVSDKTPRVGLHGDPHVEQYAVTDIGRGLTDLDDASVGPVIIDLARMGTSIILVVHEKASVSGFAGQEGAALAALFKGYRKGIDEPDAKIEPSALDKRLRKKFAKDHSEFLAFTDKNMLPIGLATDETEAKDLHDRWSKEMVDKVIVQPKNKAFPEKFFDLKRIGVVQIGIGSGLDRRYLMRVEGRTSSNDDDVIFEIKHERKPPEATCVEPSRDYTPTRFLFPESNGLSFDPIEVPGKPYWVGEWSANYKDVKIDKNLETYADLESVAFESGFLLAREHLRTYHEMHKTVPDKPALLEADKAALRIGADEEKTISDQCRTLAKETEAAWMIFKQAAAAK